VSVQRLSQRDDRLLPNPIRARISDIHDRRVTSRPWCPRVF